MTETEEIRSFIAVELSEEVKGKLHGILERLQKGMASGGARPKWVDSGGLHITLKFLGTITPEKREQIEAVLRRVCPEFPQFQLSIGGLGVFPSARQPRVLWIGVRKGAAELEAMQKVIEEEMAGLGFKAEGRSFHPHVTLARIKSLKGVDQLMDVVRVHQSSEAGSCVAAKMVLFRSDLRPTGAVYSHLGEFMFAR